MSNARRAVGAGVIGCAVMAVISAPVGRSGGAVPGAVVVAAQQPGAQQPAAPVFRGGVNFVAVDVFPRRDGAVVPNLTRNDFTVLEDGKPQTIDTFEFVHIDPNPLDADRRDPTSDADAERQAADPHNRVFVVYLDLAHTTLPGSYEARRPIVDFLTRTIGATDLFGFMTAETPVGQLVFGRRTESIDGQLAKFWTWGQADRVVMPRTAYEERLETCGLLLNTDGGRLVRVAREDALQTSLENLMVRLGELRDERKNVLFISEGWTPSRERIDMTAGGSGEIPGIGIGTGTTNRIGTQHAHGDERRARMVRQSGRPIGQHRFRPALPAAPDDSESGQRRASIRLTSAV